MKPDSPLEPIDTPPPRRRLKTWGEWPLVVKLILASLVVVVPLAAYTMGYLLPTLNAQLNANKNDELQQAVQMVTCIVEDYQKQAETGKLDLATAQREALTRISNLRYGKEGYFVVTQNGICLLNGFRPEWAGKYMLDVKDLKGYKFGMEGERLARQKGRGMVTFWWNRPPSKQPIRRRSLFVFYKPWQWTLTAGVFLDQVDAEIHRMQNSIMAALTLTLALTLALGIASARKVARPLRDLCAAAARIAQGDTDVSVRIQSHDEIGLLTTAFSSMATNIHQSHERLEARVAERTEALAEANSELRGEIQERQRAEQALRDSERRYRSVVEQISEVIFAVNREGCWSFLNPAWTQITGFTVEESLGKPFLDFLCEADRPYGLALFEAMLKQEILPASCEIRCLTRDGGRRWIEMRTQNDTQVEQNQEGFFGTLNDITERKQAADQIQHQALHDALTGLPNRMLFQERLHSALARAARAKRGLAVMFVDLDNFKTINDSMGHEAGDTLLKAIANLLQSCVREVDTTARMGGDEFTLVLEEVDSVESATMIGDRIQARLKQPIRLGAQEVFASASIGIVYSSDPTMTAEALLRDADTAMYHAKERGKSAYVLFDPAMNIGAIQRLELEMGLRVAVERHELRLHYQPLVDLQTGQIAGVEALVRWEHPTRGLIAPDDFIPLAEETGLIVPIGYWVLEEACRQVQLWQSLHPAFHEMVVNINLSGKQLKRPDIVAQVKAVLQKTGIDPKSVKLEITESVMMTDVKDIQAKLHALKALGVKLAMDDFGTGYSSLSSLSLLPLDTVKIDRSFIKQMVDQEEVRALVTAIIMLSRALQFDITGEGIEMAEQVTYLQGQGCHLGQGYYFSRPLPPDVFSERFLLPEKGFQINHDELSKEQIEQLLRARSFRVLKTPV